MVNDNSCIADRSEASSVRLHVPADGSRDNGDILSSAMLLNEISDLYPHAPRLPQLLAGVLPSAFHSPLLVYCLHSRGIIVSHRVSRPSYFDVMFAAAVFADFPST